MGIYWLEQSAADVLADDSWLRPMEREVQERFRFCKRRDEWRLGRWTAKSSVAAYLGMPRAPQELCRIEIRSRSSGAPFAVVQGKGAPIVISLTHRAGKAMCAVASSGEAIGCDLELVEPRSAAFVSDYFTLDEQALVERTRVDKRALIPNLLWSAKESALKALHLGLRVDTRSVKVCPLAKMDRLWLQSYPIPLSDVASNANEGNRLVWQPLKVEFGTKLAFVGWWALSDAFVRTVVLSSPSHRSETDGLASRKDSNLVPLNPLI